MINADQWILRLIKSLVLQDLLDDIRVFNRCNDAAGLAHQRIHHTSHISREAQPSHFGTTKSVSAIRVTDS